VWKKGQSGNPKGGKPGSGSVAKLCASLAEYVPDIIAALVSAAKDRDTAAAKLILERVVPAVKSEELAVRFPLPSPGLAEQGGAVLAGMAKDSLALIASGGNAGSFGESGEAHRNRRPRPAPHGA
jgi:hypothetical protein